MHEGNECCAIIQKKYKIMCYLSNIVVDSHEALSLEFLGGDVTGQVALL